MSGGGVLHYRWLPRGSAIFVRRKNVIDMCVPCFRVIDFNVHHRISGQMNVRHIVIAGALTPPIAAMGSPHAQMNENGWAAKPR